MLPPLLLPTLLLTLSLPLDIGPAHVIPVRLTCKQVSSCEEAVTIWCNGYRRADGDSDGIPCENVCHTTAQVDEIRAQLGC